MPRTTTRSARRNEDEYVDPDDLQVGGARGVTTRHDDDDDRGSRRTVSRRRSRDDEDERPASRTTTRSRSRDEDSADDDRDSRRASRSAGTDAKSTSIGRGREGLRKHRETHKSGSYPDKFKVDAGAEVLVKFLDDDFIVTYYEHWIQEFQGDKRQMSFVCLGPANPEKGVKDDCPLCAIGDEPKFYALINVVDLSNPRKPELKLWYATPNPGGLIEDEMDSLEAKDKVINDPNLYYVASKKKERNNFFSYSLKCVKARDLEEDGYGEPLDEIELAEFEEKAWDEEVVRLNTRKDLQDIADELSE